MTLKEAIENSPLLIGVGVDNKLLKSPLVELIQGFQTWQPHNAYKFFHSCKGPGLYDFTARDRFLAALPPGKKFRAGPIAYRFQCPGWLSKVSNPRDRWIYLEHWLSNLLQPEPWAIDVINEIYNSSGIKLNKFGALLGEDWIYRLFALVRDICPNAKLFICQNFLRSNPTWEAVRAEIISLRDRGIESHCAIQCHSTIQGALNYGGVLETRLKQLQGLCDIHISEACCWIWRWNRGKVSPNLQPFLKTLQQRTYLQWLRIAEKYQAQQFGFWSPFDQLSWELYYPDQLGIFDSDLNWCDG